jgi:hypothetical protein
VARAPPPPPANKPHLRPRDTRSLTGSCMWAGGRHRDYGRHNNGPQWQWPFDHPSLSEDVKLFVMLNDQVPDMGNTSVVFGSHTRLNGPNSLGDWRPTERGKTMGQDPHLMPNHVQFTGKAGDALLFDIRERCMPQPTPPPYTQIHLRTGRFSVGGMGGVGVGVCIITLHLVRRNVSLRDAKLDGRSPARGADNPVLAILAQERPCPAGLRAPGRRGAAWALADAAAAARAGAGQWCARRVRVSNLHV